jgi:hypothetical protein
MIVLTLAIASSSVFFSFKFAIKELHQHLDQHPTHLISAAAHGKAQNNRGRNCRTRSLGSGKRVLRPKTGQALLLSKKKASYKDRQPANASLGPVHSLKVSKAAGKRKGP